MSRIGKQPVQIPDKVKVDIKGTTVSVEGPKGKVSKTFAPVVKIEQKDKALVVSKTEETRFSRAMYGTARSVIAGMIKGATVGYAKELEITSRVNRFLTDDAFRKIALGENYFRLLNLDYRAPEICPRAQP